MGHPPYSPDLTSNDLFLFPHMRGQRFSSPEDAVEAFKKRVLEISPSVCLDKWLERMLEKTLKTIKQFLMKNIRIFIIRPEIYRATLVLEYACLAHKIVYMTIKNIVLLRNKIHFLVINIPKVCNEIL